MAAPVEPAAEALVALAAQPVHPAQPAEAAAPATAPAAAEVPVEVLNPPQAACNNDEVLLILSLASSSLLVLDCLLTPLFHEFHLSLAARARHKISSWPVVDVPAYKFSQACGPGVKFLRGLGEDVPTYNISKAWTRHKISSWPGDRCSQL